MDSDDLLRSDGRRWREDLAEESRNTALSPENRLAVLPGATGSTMRRLRVQRRRLRPLIAIAAAVTLICAGGTALFVTEYASTASSSAGTTDDLQPSAADLQQYEAVTLVSPTILPPDHLPRGAIHMPWKLMSLNADETQLTIVYVTGDSGYTLYTHYFTLHLIAVQLRESTLPALLWVHR